MPPPRRSQRVQKKPKVNPVVNGQTIKCMNWLVEQRKASEDSVEPMVEPKLEPDSDSSDYDEQDDTLAEPKVDMHPTKKKLLRKKYHDMVIAINCDWGKCNKEFLYELEFRNHVQQDHLSKMDACLSGDPQEFQCPWDLCEFRAADGAHFKRHILYHCYHNILMKDGDRYRRTYKLNNCTYDSRSRIVFPPMDKPFYCHWGDCTEQFEVVMEFIAHTRQHRYVEAKEVVAKNRVLHKKKEPPVLLTCHWHACKKTFQSKVLLKKHMYNHNHQRDLACDKCGSMFKGMDVYYTHCAAQVVAKTTEFQCSQCGKCFTSLAFLNHHFENHINKFKCKYCDMTFPLQFMVHRHIRYRHLNDRPFKCTYCEKAFVTNQDMRRHMARHEGRQYKCSECTYVAHSTNEINYHVRLRHSYEKPILFGCHICDKKYKFTCELTKHLRLKHDFHRPNGWAKFHTRIGEDLIARIQTVRLETLEVSREILANNRQALKQPDPDVEVKITDLEVANNTINLKLTTESKNKKKAKGDENNTTDVEVAVDGGDDKEQQLQSPGVADTMNKTLVPAKVPKRKRVKQAVLHDYIGVIKRTKTAEEIAEINRKKGRSGPKKKQDEAEKAKPRTRGQTKKSTEKKTCEVLAEKVAVPETEIKPSVADDPKCIDNFVVMRKYIKQPKKRIKITVEDVDDDGHVIKKSTIETQEIVI